MFQQEGRNEGSGSRLDGFLDQTGAETAGADPDPLMGPLHQRPDGLEIRAEDALGLVVGMADVMPGLMPFAAKVACVRTMRLLP